jgi:hypothetical protein
MDFFACNGQAWPWCGGAEGIDGIGWRCHRPQDLLSSHKHSFLQHVQILWMMTLKILNESVISFWKTKWEEQVFSPCSKNSVYHPFHVKPRGDYLKKTLVDLNCVYISGQSSTRAIRGYNFVGVHRRFLKIIHAQCSFCGNLQHRLHAVKPFADFAEFKSNRHSFKRNRTNPKQKSYQRLWASQMSSLGKRNLRFSQAGFWKVYLRFIFFFPRLETNSAPAGTEIIEETPHL